MNSFVLGWPASLTWFQGRWLTVFAIVVSRVLSAFSTSAPSRDFEGNHIPESNLVYAINKDHSNRSQPCRKNFEFFDKKISLVSKQRRLAHTQQHLFIVFALQGGLRFKIAMCHTDENYLKHVALLNRFKICFILKRDFGCK